MGVENQDTASPDVSEDTLDDVSTSTVVETGDTTAESSSAGTDTGEKADLLSVVRNATGRGKAATASPAEQSRDHPAASTKELDDENFSDAPFHQHPRFRQLIGQRNELKPLADKYRTIESFLTENAMSGEEATQALNTAALIKRDPEAAWAELKPIVQELLVTIGEVLPLDLKTQVQSGQMTQETAKLIAKERAKANLVKGQMSFGQAQAERQRQVAAQTAAQTAQHGVRAAVLAWETKATEDPDFAKKREDLQREVLFLQHRDGKPTTPEGVTKQLTDAMKAVNKRIEASRPRRPEIRPVTGGSTGGNPRAEPANTLDLVRNRGAR